MFRTFYHLQIYRLVMETQQLQGAQSNLTSTLDYIESQQSQLDKELDAFESKLQTVLQSTKSTAATTSTAMTPYGGVSAEETREYTYVLAEKLSQELVDLSGQVGDMVDVVNKVWKKEEAAAGDGGKKTGGDGVDEDQNTVGLSLSVSFSQSLSSDHHASPHSRSHSSPKSSTNTSTICNGLTRPLKSSLIACTMSKVPRTWPRVKRIKPAVVARGRSECISVEA